MENEKTIRYADLFGGVGGFRLGIERATNLRPAEQEVGKTNRNSLWRGVGKTKQRFSCVFYCDNDKYAVQTYNKNFKENHKATDIRTIEASDIPEIDMLCGGFPCQTFSIAGKRKGFEDTRGTLFYEIARILKAKRPRIVFLENVKGLLSHDRGRTFAVILTTIEELGYDVQWMVLNSKFFGVPQNRERVFIIGSLRGTSRPEILPFGYDDSKIIGEGTITRTFTTGGHSGGLHSNSTGIIVKGMLTDEGWDKRHESIRRVYGAEGISPAIPTGQGGGVMPKIQAVLTPDRLEKRQNGRKFKEPGEPSFTLAGQDIHGIAIMDLYNNKEHKDRSPTLTEPHHNTLRVREGIKVRRLTPIECERLQGFPDNWTEGVSETQRYKQMGNAVTVNVVQAITESLFNTQK